MIRALVLKLHNASKVTLNEDDEVPLDGFAASILRLDDRQQRVGGVTALLRTGGNPASQVPGPPALPRIPNYPIRAVLAAGEEQRLIQAVRTNQKAVFEEEGCGETPQTPEAHALDDSQALVLIPCIMGAYQGSSLAFIAQRRRGACRRLIAPTPYQGNGSGRSDAAYFTEGGFDPKTGTFSMAAKGRGLADCGVSASWIWDGRSFQLSEMALQQSCGGIEPGDWPTLFRSVRQTRDQLSRAVACPGVLWIVRGYQLMKTTTYLLIEIAIFSVSVTGSDLIVRVTIAGSHSHLL